MIRDYMRKDLKDFIPYHSPNKNYQIKLDANENPYPVSESVIRRLKIWLETKDHLTRYPDTDVHRLREKLASYYKVDKEELICTVGSDQLIDLLIKTFVEAGETVLVPNPSFSMYTLSTVINHGKAVPYELDKNFDYDYDVIIEAYRTYQPKLLFICTPNNPTGNQASIEGMKQLLNVVKCPVIIDEAYEEFINDSMIDYINQYPQLIVLRTFSKAYGIAGLRIGYGLANKEMIDILSRVKPPYNVSAFSQAAAEFVLDDQAYYREKVKEICQNKVALIKDLRGTDCFERVYETTGNFILVKEKKEGLFTYLQEQGILIRRFGEKGRLKSHLRISIGTQEENRQLIQEIKAYQKE